MEGKGIFDLSGKVALVTGGGSGLGQAYCEAMAEFGADVACVDIMEQKAQQTVKLISRYGHRAIAIKADVSKQDEIKNMVDRTVKELGTIDIVFANAGVGDKDMVKIHQATVEDWDRVFSLQPRGVFLLMQAVFPIMMKQKTGCFITTASIGGLWPIPPGELFYYPVAYSTAKAGVIMLTKLAARQYGEFGIRANAICPGYHRTPMLPEELRPIVEEAILGLTPLKRVGSPKDIKGLAVWLASDASSFVTGQVFIEDGGMIA
jgi:NAD(P)-dependent dehydrogenase (short-subunit alcohol dehydrogenase family)